MGAEPISIASEAALPAPLAAARERVASVDLVRGFVMVVMAIDHVRDMLGGMRFDPTDLSRTTPALFLTRWITHFCAPTFILLAGTGAFLSKRPRAGLSKFLLTRGLWLVLVEITVVKVAWSFNLDPHDVALQVIWVIGCSMIVLAGLIWLPLPVIAVFGLAMIAAHNLLDGLTAKPLMDFSGAHPAFVGSRRDWAVSILHRFNLPLVYPLVPWVGVMAAGYALGPVFRREPRARRRALVAIGTAATLGFLALRAINGYGDPQPWSHQATPVFTALSFLNTTKYPPSLEYLLMTLGPTLLLLAAVDSLRGQLASALAVFGAVPFFFYVLHLYLIHALALALGAWTGFGIAPFLTVWPVFPPGFGLSLGGVYLAWILVVLALYPVCLRFARVKAARRDWWLSYL